MPYKQLNIRWQLPKSSRRARNTLKRVCSLTATGPGCAGAGGFPNPPPPLTPHATPKPDARRRPGDCPCAERRAPWVGLRGRGRGARSMASNLYLVRQRISGVGQVRLGAESPISSPSPALASRAALSDSSQALSPRLNRRLPAPPPSPPARPSSPLGYSGSAGPPPPPPRVLTLFPPSLRGCPPSRSTSTRSRSLSASSRSSSG